MNLRKKAADEPPTCALSSAFRPRNSAGYPQSLWTEHCPLSASAATLAPKDTTRESAPEQWRWNAAQGPRRPKGHDRLMVILHPTTDIPVGG